MMTWPIRTGMCRSSLAKPSSYISLFPPGNEGSRSPGPDFLTHLLENAAIHVLKYEQLHCPTAQEPALLGFQKLHGWQLVQIVQDLFPTYLLFLSMSFSNVKVQNKCTWNSLKPCFSEKYLPSKCKRQRHIGLGLSRCPLLALEKNSRLAVTWCLLGRGIKKNICLCKSIYLLNWPEKYHHRAF